MKQRLNKIYERLWLAAPVAIWFSYYPNIHFGQNSTMNFELSLPLLLLLALGLASLPSIIKHWRELVKSRWVWLIVALVAYSCLTVFWSVNPLRSLLTGGVVGLLGLVAIGVIAEHKKMLKLLTKIVNVYLWSATIMAGLALVQFVAGIWLPQSATLLCDGCVSAQFGFPRSNVFAIEPQFFGNMLLPAILILAHRLMSSRAKWRLFDGNDQLSIMLLALFLTMSRGAIYALVIGLVVLAVIHIKQLRNIAMFAGISILTLIGSLAIQGTAAALSPTVSETFLGAVSKSVNQLTLGVVDISVDKPEITPVETPESGAIDKEQPAFDGYVEESTDVRMGRTELALKTWSSDPLWMIFGVGLGGAGVAVQQTFPEQTGAREIVQNEYVERLLERGLVGVVGFLIALAGLFYGTRHKKWLWAIIVALMVQWMFFSGYPNAVHIYLVMILIGVLSMSNVVGKKEGRR